MNIGIVVGAVAGVLAAAAGGQNRSYAAALLAGLVARLASGCGGYGGYRCQVPRMACAWPPCPTAPY